MTGPRKTGAQLTAAYLLGRICSAASTPSPFAFFCELTRRPFGGEARGLRHRVISPSASAGAVLVPCSAAARRSRAALSADARPEKRDRRADRGRRSRARRLATSPATGRPRERGTPRSEKTRRRSDGGAQRASCHCLLEKEDLSLWDEKLLSTRYLNTSKTVMLQVELFSPPRRGPGPRKDAPLFVAYNTPGLVGPEIEGPTATHQHTGTVPRLGGPAVSAVPAPPKLDIPRLLGP